MAVQTIRYDECELALTEAKALVEDGIFDSEEEAFFAVCSDSHWLRDEYQDFTDLLSDILKTISEHGQFLVHGSNIGWRHLSGSMQLQADNAGELIDRCFPKTDWIFRGEFDPDRNALTCRVYHHDAPTGETYEIRAQHSPKGGSTEGLG